MHQLGPRALNGLCNCRRLLVFTFLCTTNQAKGLILDKNTDFYKKLAGWKENEYDKLNEVQRIFLLRMLWMKKLPMFSLLEWM